MRIPAVLFLSLFVYIVYAFKPTDEDLLDISLNRTGAGKLPLAASALAYLESPKNPDFLPIKYSGIKDPDVLAKAFLIKDLGLSKTLSLKNANLILPIASLTKLMTAVVALENIESENLQELLEKMLVESSNEAAESLANILGMEKFVSLMNEKARELSMKNTNFKNPTGLDDPQHFSSAQDLSVLAEYISKNHKSIWEISKIKKGNTNLLLQKKFLDDLIIGGKTGFTDNALGALLVIVKTPQPNKEILLILLSSPDRFKEMEKLINWVINAYKWQTQ